MARRCEPSHRPASPSGERPWAGRSRGHWLYSSGMTDSPETVSESVTESATPQEAYAAPQASDATVRLRDVLAQMPDYKPGKPASAPAGVTAYKALLEREPLRPAPVGARSHRGRRGHGEPLPRHGRHGAHRAAREGARRPDRVPRDGHRLGRGARADRQRRLRRRRRGRLRVALVRGLPDRHPGSPARSRSWSASTSRPGTGSTRCSPRSPTAPASSSSARPTT